ncbi:MAG: DUF952 domain-containing protein [Pseudomonadota bacterium]
MITSHTNDNSRPDYVYRLITPDNWRAAQRTGDIKYETIDEADGFFHLSTRTQALQTANLFFAQEKALCALKIGVAQLGTRLRFEPVAERNSELFPHYYGVISTNWVDEVVDLKRARDHRFAWPATDRNRVAE